jgi:cephalosporin hydroxylase
MPDEGKAEREVPDDALVERFHQLWYSQPDTWLTTYWLGVKTLKCPLDLWIYQEILFTTRPDVIIETGTYSGGSALYLACICDAIGNGRVITVDNRASDDRPAHPRITYVRGSSAAPRVVAEVKQAIEPREGAMVILDSDHRKDHVLGELRAYAELVKEGSYIVVEDTNVNGHPVCPNFGPGPMEAVEEFLAEDDRFVVDAERERFLLTMNSRGYLKRVKA